MAIAESSESKRVQEEVTAQVLEQRNYVFMRSNVYVENLALSYMCFIAFVL